MPKEVVSPQVVANWFANKRKELRRRSQEASEAAAAVATVASQAATAANAANEEATSSGVGSTPSPIMEESEPMDQQETETRPLDVVALAARLGITFPQLPTSSAETTTASDTPFSQALPIATLASQILAASHNLACYSNDSQSPLGMGSLASQILPGANS
ncbi:unnamed protein product, partial [Cylicostephanus goldi]